MATPQVVPFPLFDARTFPYSLQEWFRQLALRANASNLTLTFTGGLLTVTTTGTTQDLTVAGTSGGIVYFSSASTWASSGVLANKAIVLGGGAGGSPTGLSLGTARQVVEVNTGATAPQYTSWPQMKQTVASGQTMTIDSGFSIVMAGPLVNQGTISNSGLLMVL